MKYAVTSESGMHIGLWNSRELALKVCSEYPDASIEELYTAKDCNAMVASAYEDASDIFSDGDDIHRDDYPEWFINRWDEFSSRTPADARADLERVRQEARKEALRGAAQVVECDCPIVCMNKTSCGVTAREKVLNLIEKGQTNG
jgi:hypothetical protein